MLKYFHKSSCITKERLYGVAKFMSQVLQYQTYLIMRSENKFRALDDFHPCRGRWNESQRRNLYRACLRLWLSYTSTHDLQRAVR